MDLPRPGLPDESALRDLAEQKEKEWREIQELSQTLEAGYKDKEKQLNEEKSRFQKLKEDFKYNLKLIDERDKELERYEKIFQDCKLTLIHKSAEVSDLKIKIDELERNVARERERCDELQVHYQQRLREKQADINDYRCTKDAEVQKERDGLETIKRNLQRQIKEIEDELDTQRHELTSGFDEAISRREHEYRKQVDEMSSQVLAYELKVKLLQKELEMTQCHQVKTKEEYTNIEGNHRDLEKKLKEKDWELEDTKAMKEARITELECQLKQTQESMKRMQEDYERKHAEMDRYAREKEAAITKIKEAHHEHERGLQDKIRELQSRLEETQVESRRHEWSNQDLLKDREMQVQKLHKELGEIKDKWDLQISDISRSTVTRDLEFEAIKESNEKLKAELVQRKQDIERYKKDLNLAVERESSLERSKAQLELDWQRRYEDAERHQFEKSEDLVKNLTIARDQAFSDLKEKQRDLKQREDLIRVLTRDRNAVMVTMKQHGLTLDKNIHLDSLEYVPETAQREIIDLKEQNQSLCEVIKQMREEMERLGAEMPPDVRKLKSPAKSLHSSDYIKSLELEVKELKSKIRSLQADLSDRRGFERPVAGPVKTDDDVMAEVGDNALIRSHIQSLNDMIGALRSEKVDLSAHTKKLQARIEHLESLVDQLSKQPRQKQLELDQLQYELGAQSRRNQAEVSSLRHRVSELELELAETRKEADEYFKGNLERNMEATALGNQVSAMKLQMAQRNPSINYGAQELVIQQLHEELERLRRHHAGQDSQLGFDASFKSVGHGITQVTQLRGKLKMAAKHISQLAKEKQQLIEVGNRMRAELIKNGIKVPTAPPKAPPKVMPAEPLYPTQGPGSPRALNNMVSNKLNQLEKLQYELTKQELAFAQKKGTDKGRPAQHVYNSESSSDINSDEYRPPSILKRPHSAPQGEMRSSGFRATGSSMGNTQRTSSPAAMDPQLIMSLSSVGGESLQDLWKMVDEGPSIFTSREPSHAVGVSQLPTHIEEEASQISDRKTQEEPVQPSPSTSNGWTVKGQPAKKEARTRSGVILSDKAAGKVGKKGKKKTNVRNYNVKN
ncbi:coiled-coil domain-containing protein 57-like isoform X2 [Lineus longissimus]|uniref:coiled-coil domain-containing protein 57-like isoform X2 n=1 Tax=Lineus longissimus TaxID=88925 RepID=UPI00315D4A7B